MSFDSKELARLFDAFLTIERNDPEGIEEQLNDYLFTHCDTILARLESADALLRGLEQMAEYGDESGYTADGLLRDYKKAKGA